MRLFAVFDQTLIYGVKFTRWDVYVMKKGTDCGRLSTWFKDFDREPLIQYTIVGIKHK